MKIKILKVAIFLVCFLLALPARAQEGPFHIPGIIEGSGNHFEINDSKYINIRLDSSADLDAHIESAPEMIIIRLKSSENNDSTKIVVSGLAPGTTYHKYEDEYGNHAPISTDENGAFSFVQDLKKDHVIFIQPRKSTKIIKDDATGGNCVDIGSWDDSSKTCTLDKDVNETIQISDDDITLDGKGHKVTGTNTGNGVYMYGKEDIVENITVSGFLYGIYINQSGSVISNTVKDNYYGIYAYGSNLGVTISDNIVSSNTIYGISLFYKRNNNISRNTVGPGNWVGLFQVLSENSDYENNDFSNNETGLTLYGNYNTLRKNTISGNSSSNFYIESSDMSTNDIGTDNLIDNKPIYYEKNIADKEYDSADDIGTFYCVNCQNITIKNVSFSGKAAQLVFWHTDNSLVEGLSSADKSTAVALYYSSNNTIKKSDFASIRIYKQSNGNKVVNNNIMTDDSGYTVVSSSVRNSFQEDLPVGGNYWKANKTNCNDSNNDKICDTSYIFDGGQDSYPWAKEFDFAAPSGNSNVMFLPGIKASRLYEKDSAGDEDQLWEPNYFGNDLEQLALDESGESVNHDVYTRDVIDEIGTSWMGLGPNIYKTFKEKLDSLKNDGAINDFNIFAYDWRQSVEDVAKNGTPYPDGEIKSAVGELKKLAEDSKSKKVTIVAHSNGGLLAKAIMLELQKSGEAEKVDKIVFVGTPQMGTPKAILSLLYGYDESMVFGTLMTRAEARTFAENMPGAYGLLPSKKYFKETQEPLINFSSQNTKYKSFLDAYQGNINSFDEFQKFLTGEGDHRVKPDENDVESENVLNGNILDEAAKMHEQMDNWTPPSTVQVIEIAGWGLDTISGVNYSEKEKAECYFYLDYVVPSCAGTGKYEPSYEPKFTVDGDKVVTAPSALMLPEGENVKRFWVDLYGYNDNNVPDRDHAGILETESIEQFITNILKNGDYSSSLPEYIKKTRPDDYENAKPRIRMSLYSPLDIHLYDEAGHHTGPKEVMDGHGNKKTILEEGIPNSYYYQFGERKYVGVPGGEKITMKMDGYGDGAYTLKMEEVALTSAGETPISHTTFANLPVSPETNVSLDIPETGIEKMPPLQADFDGDGNNDYAVVSVPNGEATLPDLIAPETKIDLSGTPGNNEWYISDVTVALSADDNVGGSGVDKTFYSIDREDWKGGTNFSMADEGSHNVRFYSTDLAGNIEKARKINVKIDKTAPEAKFIFNQAEQKLDIFGMDNLSPNVTVTQKEEVINPDPEPKKKSVFSWIFDIIKKGERKKSIVATLNDEAGHKTEIVLEKKENNDHRFDVSLQSVSYDGVKTVLGKSVLQYKWLLDWRGKKYLLFGSHIKTDEAALESHYMAKRNETWIMERPQELDDQDNDNDVERRSVWKKLPGMAVPYIQTEKGRAKVGY